MVSAVLVVVTVGGTAVTEGRVLEQGLVVKD